MTACTVQGMARVRSGQACPCPVVLAGVSAEAPGSSVTSRVRTHPAPSACAGCPAGTVTLRLEGRTRTLSGSSPDLKAQAGPAYEWQSCSDSLARFTDGPMRPAASSTSRRSWRAADGEISDRSQATICAAGYGGPPKPPRQGPA